MDLELEDFLRHCRLERRLADLTCSAYERDVRACLTFVERSEIRSLVEVTTPVLRAFLADEFVRRPAASSQARTVAALKCFFRFCVENEYLDRDPALVLRTPKKRKALPDVLDQRELQRLLRVPESDASGSESTPASASATASCSRSSPTPACGARSCSASTGTTSTSTGG